MIRCHERAMPCADGTQLATRLWSPDPGGPAGPGPWPVLLMRQPYGRAIASTPTYVHPRWYAERGFVVAVQDVRGRGDSQGEFGGFAQEAADGAAAVRWARRLPESNGRVGAYGFSYQGLTQLLIASEATNPGGGSGSGSASDSGGHPADAGLDDPCPDCLVPAMAGCDERLHWASEGGAHWWATGLGWALQLAAEGCRRRGDGEGWRALRHSLASGAFLEEGLALLERFDPAGMGRGWFALDPASEEGWRSHRIDPHLLQRPMLLVGGWHDPQLRGVLDLWQQARAAGGRPGLLVGDWTHLNWQGGIDSLQLAFFQRHLLGSPTTAGGSFAVSVVGEPRMPMAWAGALAGGTALEAQPGGSWFQGGSEDPPPARWSLLSDGRAAVTTQEGRLHLSPAPAEDRERGGTVVLVHDPWRPLPARGGHLGLPPGSINRAELDQRSEVACFTSEPLACAACWAARPTLRLRAAADQPGFDLCLVLSLLPEGSAEVRQLSTGFGRWLGSGALENQLREVALQPLAVALRPGDRLRLSMAPAAWPAIAVNPGDGSQPRGARGPGHRVITVTLELEGAELCCLPLLAPQDLPR